MNELQLRMPIKATPYQHQIEAFNFVCGKFGLPGNDAASTGCSLLMEMGTGKSLTAIAVTGALCNADKIRKALIICPLSITGVWTEELGKFADFDYNAVALRGTAEQKSKMLKQKQNARLQVFIVNYESAWRLEKQLLAWNADLIVADESHKIKSHSTKQSKSLHRLGAKARYKMILTGTVITNKAVDVFSQYKFVNADIFGSNFYNFVNEYCYRTGFENHTILLKKSAEEKFTEKLHSIAFRATKTECLDLPETTEIVRYVDLEPTAMKIYGNLVKDSFAELSQGEITVTNVLTRLLRLSQLTGGFINGDGESMAQQISAAKISALDDIIETSLHEDKKLVIIARFIPEIQAICDLVQSKNADYSIITGSVKNRDEQIAKFQNNPDVKVFIGQIATAGLGITLTAASIMAFYSLDYSMSNFEQAKARIHRVGQKSNCTYIYLTAKNTVDEKVLQALRNKADLAKSLVDDCRKGMNPFQ